MKLGKFSISLAVRDLAASRAFYEKLGFVARGGVPERGWLVLQNDGVTIGLFQGMFDKNTLTFNPGWGEDRSTLESFTDVRELQKALRTRGVEPVVLADETTTGPGHFMVLDPDGNPILVDQHV